MRRRASDSTDLCGQTAPTSPEYHLSVV